MSTTKVAVEVIPVTIEMVIMVHFMIVWVQVQAAVLLAVMEMENMLINRLIKVEQMLHIHNLREVVVPIIAWTPITLPLPLGLRVVQEDKAWLIVPDGGMATLANPTVAVAAVPEVIMITILLLVAQVIVDLSVFGSKSKPAHH